MAENDHTKKYSTADLERYVNGQMTPAEMYALEKDMQDDPFLAEAVEGYMTVPVPSVSAPVQELSERLARKKDTRVIVMPRRRRWLAAAAVILLILGSGATWFLLNPANEESIAQRKEEPVPPADHPPQAEVKAADTVPAGVEPTAPVIQEEKVKRPEPVKGKPAASPASAPVKVQAEEEKADNESTKPAAEAFVSADRTSNTNAAPEKAERNMARMVKDHIATYILGGTITDSATHQPLPFVNISVPDANIHTYTDANGQFKIIAGDSMLNAHVRSVGYEEKNIRLFASARVNHVQLKAGGQDPDEVVVTGYGTRKKRLEETRKEEDKKDQQEEPWVEPLDGWAFYEIYLLNNNRLNGPDHKGNVEVSFMITPSGQLYDFRVDYSNCPSCSREAVRLLKEGPRWKLYNSAAPYRASVSVQF